MCRVWMGRYQCQHKAILRTWICTQPNAASGTCNERDENVLDIEFLCWKCWRAPRTIPPMYAQAQCSSNIGRMREVTHLLLAMVEDLAERVTLLEGRAVQQAQETMWTTEQEARARPSPEANARLERAMQVWAALANPALRTMMVAPRVSGTGIQRERQDCPTADEISQKTDAD